MSINIKQSCNIEICYWPYAHYIDNIHKSERLQDDDILLINLRTCCVCNNFFL